MSEQITNTQPSRPPINLKRSLVQQRSTQSDPFQFKPSLSLSRQTQTPSLSTSTSLKSQTQKDSSINIANANVELINRKIVEEIEQQFTSSIRAKSKKSYYNSYEQKDDFGSIWLSERKWIPREVQQIYEQISNSLTNKQVNFLQGFLSQIGFMYYMVESKIYFYDIQAMNQHSACQNIIQLENKLVNACYGMQVINLSQPYISKQRKVLVILQIYTAQFYHFQIIKDNDKKCRKIELKSLNLRYSISTSRPSNLVVSRRGLLYYVNDKGGLEQLQCKNSSFAKNFTQLVAQSKRFTQEFKDFWLKMGRNISQSIRSYAKAVVNLGKSIFRSSVPQSSLLYDQKRNLLIVYLKNKDKQSYNQSIKVYDQLTQRLLYTICKQELLQKSCCNDTIKSLCVLQLKLNSDYNVVAILSSGKRVFLDITNEALRKSVVYQTSTPQNKSHSQSSHNVLMIESCVLQQTYLAQLMSTSSNFYFHFVREQVNSKYEVVYKLDVQTHGSPRQNQYYLFNRQLEELGFQKHTLLTLRNQISPKDMNQEFRQVFCKPQEIIHSSDKLTQRIVILRPIDLFFGIAYSFQNITTVFRALSIVFPSVKKQHFLGYICQILLDQEGIYYISRKQIAVLKAKMSIRLQQFQKRQIKHNLQSVQFKQITQNISKIKDRFHNLIVQIVNDQYGLSHEERDLKMAKGIITYCATIMRCVWFINVNDFDKNTCKLIITLLDRHKALISKLRLILRVDREGALMHMLDWCQKLKQLMFLIVTIAKLPDKTLHEAICLPASQFHSYVFDFVNKFCKQQIPIELKEKTHHYVNESFTKSFRFWLTFKQLKNVQQKLKLCKQQTDTIPQYLIKYIEKERGFSDIRVYLKKPKISSANIEQYFKKITTYKQILKSVLQFQNGLIEKQLLLNKAQQKLEEQAKYNQTQLSEGMTEINDLRGQIKLQKLLKTFYTTNTYSQVGWRSRLSGRLSLEETSQKNEKDRLSNLLDMRLLDSESLSELVAQTKDDYLQIVFASIFLTESVIAKVEALIDKTIKTCSNTRELPIHFKQQIRYFIEAACIDINKHTFIAIYLQKMGNLPNMMQIMQSEQGILEQDLYSFLSLIVELKGQAQKWFKWASQRLMQLDRNQPYFLYLCASTTYLVRNFIPQKRDELKLVLLRGGHNETTLKKLIVLLSDTF